LGVCALIWLVGLYLSYRINKLEIEFQKNIKQAINQIIFLDVEDQDSQKFAYNAMTKEYVCQGANLEELNKNFGLRYPNKKGIIVEKEAGETI
jgi:hypothetical protein